MIPINQDVNAKKSDYSDTLLVSSIFYTLQGEGLYTGFPCIFVRLAGCNFGSKTQVCTQCDTMFQLKNAIAMSPEELFQKVVAIADKQGCYNLVITGGEPTLQPRILDFIDLWITRVDYVGFIQFESNGTIPSFYKSELWNKCKDYIEICVSPKANETLRKYVAIPSLVDENVSFYKFLVSNDENSVYHTVPFEMLELVNDRPLYISPITVYKSAPTSEVASVFDSNIIDMELTRKNYNYAASFVLKYQKSYCNMRLSLQTHLFTAVA